MAGAMGGTDELGNEGIWTEGNPVAGPLEAGSNIPEMEILGAENNGLQSPFSNANSPTSHPFSDVARITGGNCILSKGSSPPTNARLGLTVRIPSASHVMAIGKGSAGNTLASEGDRMSEVVTGDCAVTLPHGSRAVPDNSARTNTAGFIGRENAQH
jgi:hypothetical protein